jgi:hypothetical protein
MTTFLTIWYDLFVFTPIDAVLTLGPLAIAFLLGRLYGIWRN